VNYTPISEAYPAATPSVIVAQAGDTLRSVAARAYGDASLWYIIAQENGLTNPDQDLTDGMQLRVPNQVVSLSNTSNSFKPFNPADAIGNMTPDLPTPPVPKGCGVIGMIIMVVVAVVVTVFTAGAAAAALGPLLGSFGSAVVGGAIGAAVGSIASQGVGIAIGAQDKFSWSAVGKAAIGGAIGGALFGVTSFDGSAVEGAPSTGLLNSSSGAFANGIKTFANSFGKAAGFVQGATNAAISNVLTQGASMAFGLQHSFSWRDVAASAAGGGVAAVVQGAVGPKLGGSFLGTVATKTLTGFSAGVTQKVVSGGKIDYASIAADAFGNALGNAIGNEMASTDLGRHILPPARTAPAIKMVDPASLTVRNDKLIADLLAAIPVPGQPASTAPSGTPSPGASEAKDEDLPVVVVTGTRLPRSSSGSDGNDRSSPWSWIGQGESRRGRAPYSTGYAESRRGHPTSNSQSTASGPWFKVLDSDAPEFEDLDAPSAYDSEWNSKDRRWRNQIDDDPKNPKGRFTTGPNWDPRDMTSEQRTKGDVDVNGEIKWVDLNLTDGKPLEVPIFGGEDGVKWVGDFEGKFTVVTDKDSILRGELKFGGSEYLQLAKHTFDLKVADLTGQVQAGAADLSLDAGLDFGIHGVRAGAEVGAEAVALRAQLDLQTRKLSFLDDLFVADASAHASLNAWAIGGKAEAHFAFEDWKLSWGYHASANVLFGASLSFDVNVDASKFVNTVAKPYIEKQLNTVETAASASWNRAVTTISNPSNNPLAPIGEWFSQKLFKF